jgi:outer membrane lipoprotein-sorting protein
MKKNSLKISILLLVCNLSFANLISQTPDPTRILEEMISTIKNIKTIQFSIVQTERMQGILSNQADAVKMQMNPLKIYISAENPGKSYEVLWAQGTNNGNAWIHPGAFPYITLSLNPEGNTMKLGHHSIFAINLNYLADLIIDAMNKGKKNFSEIAQYQGLYDVDGRLCYKIVLNYPTFKQLPYVVRKAEDLVSIAADHHVSEYMIFERNKNIKNYTDISPGQTILIPERYAKSIVLFIDKISKLPIIEMMYDDAGLFERYEFRKIKVNPDFPENVFSKDNPEYHF